MTNPNNLGIGTAISALDDVVQKFANNRTGLSRADIWALAVTVGADVADHGSVTQPINFTMNWFGRVDCENVNQVCLNMHGVVQPCTKTNGPTRIHASPTFNTDDVFNYFATHFSFNQRQTVAIMGAHTVGRMAKSVRLVCRNN